MEGGDLYNGLNRDRKGNLTWFKRSTDPAAPRLAGLPEAGLGKRIALDIARGLHFLHTHRIVHMVGATSPPPPPPPPPTRLALLHGICSRHQRLLPPCRLQDIKSPNVLLGGSYVAKLADVGLAKFLHKDYLSAAKVPSSPPPRASTS